MINQTILKLLFFASIALSSCAPIIYSPYDEVAPTLDEAGSGEIGLAVSLPNKVSSLLSSGGNPAIQAYGAYSPVNHLGIFGKYSRELGLLSQINTAVMGVGYYEYFESKFLFQAYLIGGLESRNMEGWNWTDNNFDVDLSRRTLGFQPTILYLAENFEYGIGCTYKKMWYKNIRLQSDVGGDPFSNLEIPVEQRLIEPYLSLALNVSPIKLQLRYGFSFLRDNNEYELNSDKYLSLGMGYMF